jgi:hypothetical protein
MLSAPAAPRARHMRLPELTHAKHGGAAASSVFAAIVPGMRLLRACLDPTAPLLVLKPMASEGSTGAGWIDAIVGTPTDAELYCIKAGLSVIPLTTEIPYTLDEGFRASVARFTGRGAG